jgi:hypothetical protein
MQAWTGIFPFLSTMPRPGVARVKLFIQTLLMDALRDSDYANYNGRMVLE